MKGTQRSLVSLLAVMLLVSHTASGDVVLPADIDKDAWHDFIGTFAECSAVYNLVATLKELPEQGGSAAYRELANNALISGMLSAEKAGLREDYLESIYSVKLGLWEPSVKDKAKQPTLLERADYCVSATLPYQNLIIATLRRQVVKQ